MNWFNFLKIAARFQMTLREALQVTGLTAIPATLEEWKKIYRKLAIQNHPDKGGDAQKFVKINNAAEVIEDAINRGVKSVEESERGGFRGDPFDPNSDFWNDFFRQHGYGRARPSSGSRPGGGSSYSRPSGGTGTGTGTGGPRPGTGTGGPRPGGSRPGGPQWGRDRQRGERPQPQDPMKNKTWANLDKAKMDIYEKAKQAGGGIKGYSIWAFDGSFFRGAFEAYMNPQTFGFAGEVMEFWNSKGGNPYPTKAVFVSTGGNTIQCIRLNGKDVSGQNITFQHKSMNKNPGNDPQFVDMLRKWVAEKS